MDYFRRFYIDVNLSESAFFKGTVQNPGENLQLKGHPLNDSLVIQGNKKPMELMNEWIDKKY